MGRNGKYNPDTFPLLAEQYAMEGMIDTEIAKMLGVAPSKFYEYQKKYTEFRESIKRGKQPVDFVIEKALLKRAMGYEYEETEREADPLTKQVTKIKKKTKEMPGNVLAQRIWLFNRKPEKWRIRKDLPLSGDMEKIEGFNYIVPKEPKKKK